MTLNLTIRELRKERGLTLAQLAEKVGVSAPHMSEVERGKKNLNNHLLVRISTALGVEPVGLIGGDQGADRLAKLTNTLLNLNEEDLARVRSFAEMLEESSKPSQ